MRINIKTVFCNFLFATVLSAIFGLCTMLSGTADTFELHRGANFRQNILIMRWPSGLNTRLFPEGSFGVSATRARIWSRVYRGAFVLNGAVESKANFFSSGTDSGGLFGEGGGIFGTSRPLERWDLTAGHIEEKSMNLRTRLERLDLRGTISRFDIDIGRQPVSLGTSHFVGVLDVIAPFAPGDLDATYKPGVDAVRVRRGIGMTGEAEIIAVGEKKWRDGAFLGRSRCSLKVIDVELVGGYFRRRTFGGIGWEGGIGSCGLWGEMALFQRRKDHEVYRGGWSEAAFSGVAGLDVRLADNTIVGAALMFQDFGVRDPEDLTDVYSDAPYQEGWVFLGSASYGVVTVHRQLHPLVNGDVAGLVNLIDGSSLWQPRLTISTGDNSDLSVYGWIGTGKKARIDGTIVTMRSEFGMLPDGCGFYARWFF